MGISRSFEKRLIARFQLVASALLLALLLHHPIQAETPITEVRPLPAARAFHGTAVLGDYLYVIGGAEIRGTDYTDATTVLKAPIAANGQIGNWTPTTPIPSPRHYIANSTVVLNDVVYVVGGSSRAEGGTSYNTALWAKPLADGTLTPWNETPPFGEGFTAAAAVTTPGHLHVLGGAKRNRRLSTDVWTNSIYLDGSLGSWEAGPSLPYAIWFHSAGVVAGRLYMWGGIPGYDPKEVSPSHYVISSPILASGKLGPWRREKTMLKEPFYSAASAVAGHYLLSFSPRYSDGTESNDIWWSYVTPAGVQPFRKRETNIPIRIYHAVAPDYRRGTIYIPSGRPARADERATNRVFFFSLSGQAREQAERAWQAHQAAHAHSAAAKTDATGGGGRQLTYLAESTLSTDALPGFMTVSEARSAAAEQRKPLVLYFTLKDAQPCIEQARFLADEQFGELAKTAAFGWVDTTEFPQLVQQMGVYRVPTWIFYDDNGLDRGRRVGVLSTKELAGLLPHLISK